MIAGRYTRDREIGRGGMGAVWLGRDEVLGRPVAIKRIGSLPGGAGPDLARAEREAKIAASIHHPNIVGVFDLVVEDEAQWMIMEYVEGTTLGGLVRERGALSPEAARPLIAQAASALAAAHANGIVHRDVKPSNILVREDGHVKLTDFGIARGRTDAALTQTGLVTGSPAYIAPEVASGQQATSASDVWSLGATVFHALAGHPPYDAGENVLGALYRIVNEPPPRFDGAGSLAPLLEATMVRDPDQRWTMDDIGRFLSTGATPRASPSPSPVTATAPTIPARATSVAAESQPTTADLPAVLPDPTPQPTPAPTPAPSSSSRRRPLLPALIAALVAALVVAIVFLALQADPQENLAGPGEDATTGSTGPAASPDETEETEEPQAPTRKEMRGFLDSYLSVASSDPDAGFQLLTPAFQDQSSSYEQFWGNVSNPQLLSFSADPSALTVSYTYRYQFQGSQRTESVALQLVATDDGFLIDGEA